MAQFRSRMFEQPYYIGLDYSRNLEDYGDSPPDSFSQFHKDDREGYVLEFVLGEKGKKGDWQVGYYYSYLEALSVHSSYIADDWVRWGNANQVRATNLKGSELRAIYSFSPTNEHFRPSVFCPMPLVCWRSAIRQRKRETAFELISIFRFETGRGLMTRRSDCRISGSQTSCGV